MKMDELHHVGMVVDDIELAMSDAAAVRADLDAFYRGRSGEGGQ